MAKIPDGFAERMIRFRARNNMGQREFANLCKLTVQTVGNIENGRRTGVTRLTLAKIEEVINDAEAR